MLLFYPEFVTGLLNSVGTHINPTKLIQVSMTIPIMSCVYIMSIETDEVETTLESEK